MEKKEEKAERIFERVLKFIKPEQKEIESNIAFSNMLVGRLKEIVPRDVKVMVLGSLARGTYLKGSADVDVFLIFNKKVGREHAIKKGLEYAKKAVKKEKGEWYELRYAEHPYIRAYFKYSSLRADIVPALEIENIEDMGTSVDRTPLHNEFVNANLSEKQKDEVRLLKQMLKAHDIYGAEVKTGGFPGYLCELLIINYGSLWNLLKAFASIKLPIVIYPKEKREDRKAEILKKFSSKFVVVDPVDSNRNVAAGVSEESLYKFIVASQRFTRRPNIGEFMQRGYAHRDMKELLMTLGKLGLSVKCIELSVKEKSEDVIIPQLRRISKYLESALMEEKMNVIETGEIMKARKGYIILVFEKSLSKYFSYKGPPIEHAYNSGKFFEEHRGAEFVFVKGSSLYAIEKRRERSCEEVMREKMRACSLKLKDVALSSFRLIDISKGIEEDVYLELKKSLFI
ncbi:MAG: CCA tRNA nucleotidyltransferase [Candidatus Micrarchaeaceae archaeon]